MTDINRLLASLKRRSAHAKEFGDSITFVKLKDIDALIEALEKAQSANVAQDDHINQQQDRIEQLEKRNAELGKYAKELESFRTAYMEWSDKTDWVQGDKRFDVLIPWGKHRADVLKAYIEYLELRFAELEQEKVALESVAMALRDDMRESRTVTVKLPAERFCPAEYAGSQLWSETEVWNQAISACNGALRTAGIKVEAE
ncbi:hypothetical protein MAK22_001962 [Klebsiella aerogenes]|nr:hypothetical protein [Klebsiella aerogenes]EKZ5300148.1 hypothetical protein [Klebsiella aerogenes]